MGNFGDQSNKLLRFNSTQIPTELIPGLPDDLAVECLARVPISSHPSLRLVSHGWNAVVSSPSFFSDRRRLGSAEHLICLIQPLSPFPTPPPPPPETTKDHPPTAAIGGGPPLYNLNVYNLSRQEWRRLSVPVPTFAQCVAVPEVAKVVVLGGWDPLTLEPVKRVLVVDLMTGTWKEGSPMPTARSFFATAAVAAEGGGASVYVAGGHDGQKNALRSAEVYDLEADEWRQISPMAEERDESQGISFDGCRFWVVSGYGTEWQGRFRPDGEVYDPKTGSWSRVNELWPYPNTTPKSTAAIGGLLRGGSQSERLRRWWFVGEGEVREFEWEERRWKRLDSGPVPKTVSGSSSISLVHIGDGKYGEGEIFVMGNGENCGGEGAFTVVEERENEGEGKGVISDNNSDNKDGGGIRWKLVHVPTSFMGFPFSASHLLV